MKQRKLGQSDVLVSRLALGTATWGVNTSRDDAASSSGRIRHAGTCNYSGWQTAFAAASRMHGSRPPLVSAEVEYSLLERGIEREVVPAAQALSIGVLPWAPLGRGVLTGKYRAGIPEKRARNDFFKWYVGHFLFAERTTRIVDALAAVATDLGASPPAVSLAL